MENKSSKLVSLIEKEKYYVLFFIRQTSYTILELRLQKTATEYPK